MKHLLALLILALMTLPATAQTQTQRGVARMITRSLTAPVKPVSGVSVVVGNSASKASDAQGRFTLSIVKNKVGSFQLTDVKLPKNSTLILASPSKKKTLFLSQDELAITFTTPEDQKAVSRTTYQRLKKQYDQQAQELITLRTQLESQQTALQNNAAASAQLKARIDSIQTIINDYFDEKKRDYMLKELQRIADELALMDYQSLDSLERRIYDLRQAGEWQAISTLLHTLMHGNAAAWLSALASRADRAERDFQFGVTRMQDAIEAFKMQHLNDSAAHYYALLTRADSTNSDLLNEAGIFELGYMARYDRAHNYFNVALRHTDVDTVRANIYYNIGALYFGQNNYNHAEEFYLKALDIDKSARGEHSEHVASIYNALGEVYRARSDFRRALEYYDKAYNIQRERLGAHNEETIATYLNAGVLCYDVGDLNDAEGIFISALALLKTHTSEQGLAVANCYASLANLFTAVGRYSQAEDCYKKALEIDKALLGDEHPDVAIIYDGMGVLNTCQRQYIAADNFLQMALHLLTNTFGERHLAVANVYRNFGGLYEAQENFEKAELHYKKALDIQLSILGETADAVATSYNNLGLLYCAHKDYDLAWECHNKELSINIALYGNEHPYVANSYYNLGLVHLDEGMFQIAKNYVEKALEIDKAALGDNNSTTKQIQETLDYINSQLSK